MTPFVTGIAARFLIKIPLYHIARMVRNEGLIPSGPCTQAPGRAIPTLTFKSPI